jgi:hypothetical protein
METFVKRVTWLEDGAIPMCHIITNYVAHGNILARIEEEDWEMMCKAEAFDHIYLNDRTESTKFGYDIRVSKGPWKVDYTR